MDRAGSAPALVARGGRLADLGRAVAAAVTSGAPVVAASRPMPIGERHTRHAASITAASASPVRLLLPRASSSSRVRGACRGPRTCSKRWRTAPSPFERRSHVMRSEPGQATAEYALVTLQPPSLPSP